MKQKICKLIGHTVKFHDGPYPVCDRCGAHGHYNDEEYSVDLLYWPLRLFEKARWRLEIWKQNRAARRPLREDEIPF